MKANGIEYKVGDVVKYKYGNAKIISKIVGFYKGTIDGRNWFEVNLQGRRGIPMDNIIKKINVN